MHLISLSTCNKHPIVPNMAHPNHLSQRAATRRQLQWPQGTTEVLIPSYLWQLPLAHIFHKQAAKQLLLLLGPKAVSSCKGDSQQYICFQGGQIGTCKAKVLPKDPFLYTYKIFLQLLNNIFNAQSNFFIKPCLVFFFSP